MHSVRRPQPPHSSKLIVCCGVLGYEPIRARIRSAYYVHVVHVMASMASQRIRHDDAMYVLASIRT